MLNVIHNSYTSSSAGKKDVDDAVTVTVEDQDDVSDSGDDILTRKLVPVYIHTCIIATLLLIADKCKKLKFMIQCFDIPVDTSSS